MTHRDKVTALRIDLESGVIIAVIKREYLNDDGSFDHAIDLDGAHGQSPIFDDPAFLVAAQTFAEKVIPHVELRFASAECVVVDGVAVATKRRDDAAREVAEREAAEAVPE